MGSWLAEYASLSWTLSDLISISNVVVRRAEQPYLELRGGRNCVFHERTDPQKLSLFAWF